MNIKWIIIPTAILVMLPYTIVIRAGDFGQVKSLFSDIKADKVGDILTVNIYENTQATNKTETETEKSSDASVENDPGSGFFDFIPLFGAGASISNTFDGKGDNLRNRNLRAGMLVTVVAANENGDLVIEGSRPGPIMRFLNWLF